MFDLPLTQIVEKIKSREIKAISIMESVYENIDKYNPQLNVYCSCLPKEKAFRYAENIDKKIADGKSSGKLAGIPVSVKNNICSTDPDLKTTCSSKILSNFNSPYNATVVDKLLKEDAIIIGQTNMDEFAMGSSTESSAFGATLNPWDLERVPGGSSGGAAVSIAAKMALLALGSDTGGSIRQPASFCGVTGFKPSYGAVSRYGLVAYGSSLDQIGCLAKNADDCAYGFSVIEGYDPHDSTSARIVLEKNKEKVNLSDLKFCLPREYVDSKAVNENVIASVLETSEFLKKEGAVVEERSLSWNKFLIPTYYILAFAEASSNLGRFDGIRYGIRKQNEASMESLYKTSRSEGFGTEVKRRIMLGTFVLSAGYYDQYYGKACQTRIMIEREMDKLLNEFDFILGPIAPNPAFKLGEKTENPLSMYMEDIFSVLPNLAQVPAISIQGKPSKTVLPNGVQLIGRKFSDYRLLAVSYALQNKTNFHQLVPPLIKS